MKHVFAAMIIGLLLFPDLACAGGLPKSFHEIESSPKIRIFSDPSGWPSYEVESVKYQLTRLFIKPGVPSATYLIKEKYKTKITDGAEGSISSIVLELWELGDKEVTKRLWRISKEADKWQFQSHDEIVLVKYGCCDSPNEYHYYDVRTGSFLKTVKGTEKRPASTSP